MLSFRQFLECNDIDTSGCKANELANLNWNYENAYLMYCNATAHELQKDVNYKAFKPFPSPVVLDASEQDEVAL